MELEGRGERILRTAGELLVAWGYRRVTIEEIARRAGVGKGTVYLHWKTKDALLLAVVLDSKQDALERQLARMRADPLEVLPSAVMSRYYCDALESPVLRAVHTDDSGVLGRLGDIAAVELAELVAHGDRALDRHLGALRACGLVRDDMALADQRYTLIAILVGFFMADTYLDSRAPAVTEPRARLLAHTVQAALETPAGPTATPDGLPDADRVREAAARAAPGIIAVYEHIAQLSAEEMRRQLRP
ncbi:TetR/AcrR family transcriptional regulator [Streptomyces pinistramenti]|uniref:TetR/AcrR family transcriptional regulator n=1 Tax=Streptomyces pinistramenti TaxID=2884812 RepID=UPI001D0744EE|nr:TetR/AcrR family transcriptional regulator [Streptomyces pinistramenti]MCB5912263.1 TetR/AcrR family transcriptional regulator [Streptomyces pinistramenti]